MNSYLSYKWEQIQPVLNAMYILFIIIFCTWVWVIDDAKDPNKNFNRISPWSAFVTGYLDIMLYSAISIGLREIFHIDIVIPVIIITVIITMLTTVYVEYKTYMRWKGE